MASLEELRRQLGEIDEEILRLVSHRQEVAAQIGRVKQQEGQGTRAFAQEKEVVERARRVALQLKLPEELGEELVELLIRHSLTRQEQQRVQHRGSGSGQRVLVIGGAGRMGRWFVRFLASQGYEVEIADPAGPLEGYDYTPDWEDADLLHDLIVVATPLRVTQDILLRLAERRPSGLVFDIGSLKSVLRQPLHRLVEAGIRTTSIHPMFGPDTELLLGQHVIFVDLGVPEATRQARRLFDSTMAVQVEMNLEDHDRLIAYVLGLSHALNIAFFTALAESGEAAKRLAQMSSTTFNAQFSVASSVAQENPHLYFEIQSLNDYGSESLAALLYALERIRSVVLAKDEPGFVKLMETGRAYLSSRQR